MYKAKHIIYGIGTALLWCAYIASERTYTHQEYHNITFMNDSDKKLYVYSDNEFQDEVPPRSTYCFGLEFFQDKNGFPQFRYLKAYHTKPVTFKEQPVIKYIVKPRKNFFASTQVLQEVNEEWPHSCMPPRFETLVALGDSKFTIKGEPYTITLDQQTGVITIKDKEGKVTSSFTSSLTLPDSNLTVDNNRLRVVSSLNNEHREFYNIDNPKRPFLAQG